MLVNETQISVVEIRFLLSCDVALWRIEGRDRNRALTSKTFPDLQSQTYISLPNGTRKDPVIRANLEFVMDIKSTLDRSAVVDKLEFVG